MQSRENDVQSVSGVPRGFLSSIASRNCEESGSWPRHPLVHFDRYALRAVSLALPDHAERRGLPSVSDAELLQLLDDAIHLRVVHAA